MREEEERVQLLLSQFIPEPGKYCYYLKYRVGGSIDIPFSIEFAKIKIINKGPILAYKRVSETTININSMLTFIRAKNHSHVAPNESPSTG